MVPQPGSSGPEPFLTAFFNQDHISTHTTFMNSVSFSGSDEEPRERTVVPAPLRRGDLIGMLAPASAVSADYCAGAARRLEEAGFRVRLYPSCGGVSGS